MADTKITSLLTPQVTTNPATDVLPIVNIADTSMASSGSTRKITVNTLLGSGGTATLASATITGDLTVRTDKLAVRSTGVGIGTTTPNASYILDLTTAYDARARQWVADSSFIGSGNLANGFTIRTLSGTTDGIRFLNYAQSTEFMRIDATGLGVGRSPISKLNVDKASQTPGGTTPNGAFVITDTVGSNLALEFGVNSASLPWIQSRNSTINSYYDLLLNPNGGNVGIGVTPSAWGSGFRYVQAGPGCAYGTNGSVDRTDLAANWYYNGGDKYINATGKASIFQQSGGAFFWLSTNTASGGAGSAMTLNTNMTLDASGNLLVGTTSNAPAGTQSQFVNQWSGGAKWGSTFNQTVSSATAYTHIAFCTNGTVRGSIDANNATLTYGTVSDYRLKDNVQPLSNGLARVNALKPSSYKWKESEADGEGFIAHELASVVPLAVTGQKDAVNEDGSIKPQQVDLSKVVPVLVAAIQELTARVQTLETR